MTFQVVCLAALVWSWGAGFGGADAPWSEAASHTASNVIFGASCAGMVLNAAGIYLAVTRMPWPWAVLSCGALLPACLLSAASTYGLLVVSGWA